MIKDSPDPTKPLSIDLLHELNLIDQKNYHSDYSFQEDLYQLFIRLHDAHTRYIKPLVPYQVSAFIQPFRFSSQLISSSTQKNEQALFLRKDPNWMDAYLEVYGDNITSIEPNVDYQILEINGQSALDAMIQFANHSVGYSRDINARFNLAIQGYDAGMFGYRSQGSIPESSYIEYELTDPSNSRAPFKVNVTWMGGYNSNQMDLDLIQELDDTDFRRERVITQSLMTDDEYSIVSFYDEYELNFDDDTNGKEEEEEREKEQDEITLEKEKQSSTEDISTQLLSPDTGMLRVRTFSPKNYSRFIHAVQNGLHSFAEQGVNKLVIDLRQNGGGDICTSYALLRYLWPEQAQDVLIGTYDMKHSDLFDALADAGSQKAQSDPSQVSTCGQNPVSIGYFTPCAWYNATTGQCNGGNSEMFSDISYYRPGVQHIRGGVKGMYSQFIHEGCQYNFDQWTPAPKWKTPSPSNTVILSDSLCGSSCAVFSRYIQQFHLAKAVTIGGIRSVSHQDFSSFAGGEVETVDYINRLAVQYDLDPDNPYLPPPLPHKARFRFTIREIYPWGLTCPSTGLDPATQTPLEFTPAPTDFRMWYSYAARNRSDDWVYSEIMKNYFDVCTPWETKSCDVKHGRGVRQCESDGNIGEECTIIACDLGYFSSNETSTSSNSSSISCVPCPKGQFKNTTNASSECSICDNAPKNAEYTEKGVSHFPCPFQCSNGYALTKDGNKCERVFSLNVFAGSVAGAFGGALLLTIILVIPLTWCITRKCYKRETYRAL